jgi:cytidylate kinase
MYRAFGLHCRAAGIDLLDACAVAARLRGFELPDLGDPALLSESAGEAASIVSQIPKVRKRMVALQRAMGLRTGGVVEGRDATTRIFPDATRKFFLFAEERVRIWRRWREVRGDWVETARQVAKRDKRDRERAASPLILTADAVPVDTTALNADQVVDLLAFLCGEGRG